MNFGIFLLLSLSLVNFSSSEETPSDAKSKLYQPRPRKGIHYPKPIFGQKQPLDQTRLKTEEAQAQESQIVTLSARAKKQRSFASLYDSAPAPPPDLEEVPTIQEESPTRKSKESKKHSHKLVEKEPELQELEILDERYGLIPIKAGGERMSIHPLVHKREGFRTVKRVVRTFRRPIQYRETKNHRPELLDFESSKRFEVVRKSPFADSTIVYRPDDGESSEEIPVPPRQAKELHEKARNPENKESDYRFGLKGTQLGNIKSYRAPDNPEKAIGPDQGDNIHRPVASRRHGNPPEIVDFGQPKQIFNSRPVLEPFDYPKRGGASKPEFVDFPPSSPSGNRRSGKGYLPPKGGKRKSNAHIRQLPEGDLGPEFDGPGITILVGGSSISKAQLRALMTDRTDPHSEKILNSPQNPHSPQRAQDRSPSDHALFRPKYNSAERPERSSSNTNHFRAHGGPSGPTGGSGEGQDKKKFNPSPNDPINFYGDAERNYNSRDYPQRPPDTKYNYRKESPDRDHNRDRDERRFQSQIEEPRRPTHSFNADLPHGVIERGNIPHSEREGDRMLRDRESRHIVSHGQHHGGGHNHNSGHGGQGGHPGGHGGPNGHIGGHGGNNGGNGGHGGDPRGKENDGGSRDKYNYIQGSERPYYEEDRGNRGGNGRGENYDPFALFDPFSRNRRENVKKSLFNKGPEGRGYAQGLYSGRSEGLQNQYPAYASGTNSASASSHNSVPHNPNKFLTNRDIFGVGGAASYTAQNGDGKGDPNCRGCNEGRPGSDDDIFSIQVGTALRVKDDGRPGNSRYYVQDERKAGRESFYRK